MAGDATELVARFERLRTDRQIFETRWEQIRKYQRPDSGPFFDGLQEARGTRYSSRVFDNTAEDAADLAAAGIGGLLTGQSIDWHTWKWSQAGFQPDFHSKAWLDECSRRQLALYRNPRARFGLAMDAMYLDLIDYANACIFVKERFGRVPLYVARPIQQIYWTDNEDGEIDTVFWRFRYSARQAARAWGKERLPDKIRTAAESAKNAENDFDFLHAVFPSDDPQAGKYALGPKPFVSCWISFDDKSEIARGGYNALPYIPFRWRVRAGERYARGPSDKALPDVAVLQEMDMLTLEAIEIAVQPTLMVADDGISGRISQRASDVITVRSDMMMRGTRDPIRPLQTGVRPDVSEDAAEARRQRIQRAFLRDLLQILRDPRATATQILEIREEQFRTAAPIVNGLEAESLGPLAERSFDLLARGGFLPPPPPHIAGLDIDPDFQSPVARAQRLSYVRGYSQLWDMIVNMANASQDPSLLDIVDTDTGIRRSAEALGVAYEVIRSPEAVAGIRQQREEAKQAAAEQEAELDASTVAKNLAPFMKAAQETGDSEEAALQLEGGDFQAPP